MYATPSSRDASIKCCRARRVAARVAHKILWQPKRGTTTTFRIQQHLQMSRCALYPCICEIRRYTDSEHYATFTFCSSTVSVAIYATHKKTDRKRGGEGQREEKRGGEQRIHPSLRFSAGCRLSFSLVGELGALHLHSILVKSVAHSMLATCRAGWGRGKGRVACRCDAFQSVSLLYLGHGYQIRQTSAVSISPYPLFPSVSVSRTVTETNLKY